jgi:ferredoxin
VAEARDCGGSGGKRILEHMSPDLFELDDEGISNDTMDVDNHIVNPDEFRV